MIVRHSNPLIRFTALLLACTTASLQAQSATGTAAPQTQPAAQDPQAAQNPQATQPAAASQPTAAPEPVQPAKTPQTIAPPAARPAKLPTTGERRQAAKLYMQAAGLYEKQKFEEALDLDRKAAALDPTNTDYMLAAEVARSHAVTALIQEATHDQIKGDVAGAHAALEHALELDPNNTAVTEHLQSLADQIAGAQAEDSAALKTPALAGPLQIFPKAGIQTFHLRNSQRQIIQQVFAAYGITATVDTGVRNDRARLDLDDVTFAQAARAVSLMSSTFYVPIDAHRVLVARNTMANRMQYMRNAVDTVRLSGLSTTDMTEMGNIARNVFELRQINVDPSAGTLTMRGPADTLSAFNATYQDLQEGRSQILLDVRLIQLAHTNARNTGVQLPQTLTALNVYAEEQAILQQNADLVQQIIASGLAAPGDTLAIIGILLASGQVSSSIFQNGLLLFGGGITQSALVVPPVTVNLSLNSSESRALDNFRLRLQDGEEGTLKSGSRYPIITSSFSSAGAGGLGGIPGLSSAGTSSNLAGLLAGANLASVNIPQFQYEDLGLVLKARPRVLRSGDVAMTFDLKITALAGSSINNVPVLNNRAYTGAVTVPANQAVVLTGEIDKTEVRAISGYPGLSEIPGLNNITDKNVELNAATLLIVITPHVIRSPHEAGATPMLHVDRTSRTR